MLGARYTRSTPHRRQGVLHLCHVSWLRHTMLTDGSLPLPGSNRCILQGALQACSWTRMSLIAAVFVCCCTGGDVAASAAACLSQAHSVWSRQGSILQTCCDSACRSASSDSDRLQVLTYTGDFASTLNLPKTGLVASQDASY